MLPGHCLTEGPLRTEVTFSRLGSVIEQMFAGKITNEKGGGGQGSQDVMSIDSVTEIHILLCGLGQVI